MWLLLATTLSLLSATETGQTLVDFHAKTLPDFVVWHNAHGTRVTQDGGHAWEVRFEKVDWPNVCFQAPDGAWDWRAYAGVAVSLYNSGDETVQVSMRVDNEGADGMNHCNNASASVPPHGRVVLGLRMNTGAPEKLWGMRGVPVNFPLGQGPVIDASKITAFQVFLPRPQKEFTLRFERAWLIKKKDVDKAVSMPFIDRFGQYKHAGSLSPGSHSNQSLRPSTKVRSFMPTQSMPIDKNRCPSGVTSHHFSSTCSVRNQPVALSFGPSAQPP